MKASIYTKAFWFENTLESNQSYLIFDQTIDGKLDVARLKKASNQWGQTGLIFRVSRYFLDLRSPPLALGSTRRSNCCATNSLN